MIWYDWYDMICCDMIWCVVIWYDRVWYDMIDMIWYVVIWYDWYDMIRYDMIWYDMVWYMFWYDMICCDVIWYDWYNIIWYDSFICIWLFTNKIYGKYVSLGQLKMLSSTFKLKLKSKDYIVFVLLYVLFFILLLAFEPIMRNGQRFSKDRISSIRQEQAE